MSAPVRRAKSVLHFTFQELVAAHDKLLIELEERDATIKRLREELGRALSELQQAEKWGYLP